MRASRRETVWPGSGNPRFPVQLHAINNAPRARHRLIAESAITGSSYGRSALKDATPNVEDAHVRISLTDDDTRTHYELTIPLEQFRRIATFVAARAKADGLPDA